MRANRRYQVFDVDGYKGAERNDARLIFEDNYVISMYFYLTQVDCYVYRTGEDYTKNQVVVSSIVPVTFGFDIRSCLTSRLLLALTKKVFRRFNATV